MSVLFISSPLYFLSPIMPSTLGSGYDEEDDSYAYANGPIPSGLKSHISRAFLDAGNGLIPDKVDCQPDPPLINPDKMSAPKDLIRAVSSFLLDAQSKIPASVKVSIRRSDSHATPKRTAACLLTMTSLFTDSGSSATRAMTRSLLHQPSGSTSSLIAIGPAVPSAAPPPSATSPCGRFILAHFTERDPKGAELKTGVWVVSDASAGVVVARIPTPHATVCLDAPNGFFCLSGAAFGPPTAASLAAAATAGEGSAPCSVDTFVYTAVVEPPAGSAAPHVWDSVMAADGAKEEAPTALPNGATVKPAPDVGGQYAYRPSWGEKETAVNKRVFALSVPRRAVAQVVTRAGYTAYSPAVTPCGRGVVYVGAQHEVVRRVGCSAYTTRPTSLFVSPLPAPVLPPSADRTPSRWEQVAAHHGGVVELIAGGSSDAVWGHSMPSFSQFAAGWGALASTSAAAPADAAALAFVYSPRTLAHATACGVAVAAWPPVCMADAPTSDTVGEGGPEALAARGAAPAPEPPAVTAPANAAPSVHAANAGLSAAARTPHSGLRLRAWCTFDASERALALVPACDNAKEFHRVAVDGLAWPTQPLWVTPDTLLVETMARSSNVPLLLRVPSADGRAATSAASGDMAPHRLYAEGADGAGRVVGSAVVPPLAWLRAADGRLVDGDVATSSIGTVEVLAQHDTAVAVKVSSLATPPKLMVCSDITDPSAGWSTWNITPQPLLAGVSAPAATDVVPTAIPALLSASEPLHCVTLDVLPTAGPAGRCAPRAMALAGTTGPVAVGAVGAAFPPQAGDVVVLRSRTSVHSTVATWVPTAGDASATARRDGGNEARDVTPEDTAAAAAAAIPDGRPVVLWIHGGPHAQVANRWLTLPALLAAAGCTVVLANYVGSTGFGREFCEALLGHCGRLDVAWLARAVRQLCCAGIASPMEAMRGPWGSDEAAPGALPMHIPVAQNDFAWGLPQLRGVRLRAPLGVTGGSHGGFLSGHLSGALGSSLSACVMANAVTYLPSMIATTDIPDWCLVEAGAVAPASWTPPFAHFDAAVVARLHATSPYSRVRGVRAPTLLLTGSDDHRVPKEQNRLWYHALQQQGVNVRMRWYPGEGHAIGGPAPSLDCAIEHGVFLLTKLLRR